ncbi:MAG: 3-isopropylmalate dehydrogenase [Bacteroidales bacterium]
MTTTTRIALLPGDGIGAEVTGAALAVLRAVGRRFGRRFEFEHCLIGGAALRAHDAALPRATLDACRAADAVLLGAVGDPAFDREPAGRRPEIGLLELRLALGSYANLRPVRLWPGLETASPLRPDRVQGLDLIIVRELTGGLYFGQPRGFDAERGEAFNTMRYTAPEVERIAAVAFRLAASRRGSVVSVDKANVLETSRLWRTVVERVASRFPDVRLDHQYVDSCALSLVLEPRNYDVILTENLFGDILSDQAGGLAGSLGLLPSASLGEGPGLFEPVHGSAPALAGRDAANPVGAILSAAMLLRHTGAAAEASAVESAVAAQFVERRCTSDLAHAVGVSPASCSQVADAVAAHVEAA